MDRNETHMAHEGTEKENIFQLVFFILSIADKINCCEFDVKCGTYFYCASPSKCVSSIFVSIFVSISISLSRFRAKTWFNKDNGTIFLFAAFCLGKIIY